MQATQLKYLGVVGVFGLVFPLKQKPGPVGLTAHPTNEQKQKV